MVAKLLGQNHVQLEDKKRQRFVPIVMKVISLRRPVMSRSSSKIIFLLLISFGLSIQIVYGQNYTVWGIVTDVRSGHVLSGVVFTMAGFSATTNDQGKFVISDIPGGTYDAVARLDNYLDCTGTIVVEIDNGFIPVRMIGKERNLGIISRGPRKDTRLICMDGCSFDGDYSYKNNHFSAALRGPHDYNHCWLAAAHMINQYYGGDMTQDEIAFRLLTDGPGTPPEGDFYHGKKLSVDKTLALFDVVNHGLFESRTIPPDAAYYIDLLDDETPIFLGQNGHARIISGYRYIDKKLYLLHLNTDNEGRWAYYTVDQTPIGFQIAAAPVLAVGAVLSSGGLETDTDYDGLMDFDEDLRFTWLLSVYDDMDNDAVPDGIDVESYLYDQFGNWRQAAYDLDGDNLRGEVDPDSDNGGVIDGYEDTNRNGRYDDQEALQETMTHGCCHPDADDIPNVRISLSSTETIKDVNGVDCPLLRAGGVTATLRFYKQNGWATLPLYHGQNGVRFLWQSDTASEPQDITAMHSLVPVEDCNILSSSVWEIDFNVLSTTRNGWARFIVKNGNNTVGVIEGSRFCVDTKKGVSSVKEK